MAQRQKGQIPPTTSSENATGVTNLLEFKRYFMGPESNEGQPVCYILL